jgi:guanylate kinase
VQRTGIPFVVSGPSGVGKTTILRRVIAADPGVAFCVSHTTRSMRAGERGGEDYHFVDGTTFDRLIEEDRFLEWAVYQGNQYGTSREAVEGPTRKGIDLILEVEVQGARQLRDRLGEAVFIFVLPPSRESLEERLRTRKSDSEEAIRKRLARAREEIREVHHYDYAIVNDDVDLAVEGLLHVIAAGRLARTRVLPTLQGRLDFG